MKITRLKISNYAGIEDMTVEVPPSGIIVKGEEATGKTTVLNAISAALGAQGCDPKWIRHGAEKAEILVEIDSVGKVRRRIGQKSSSVDITTTEGLAFKQPQTKLNELLGTSALDPLELFSAKSAAERRKLILESAPVAVTMEELREWCGGLEVPSVDLSVHGLDVVAGVRKHFYGKRTEANKAAKEARARLEIAQEEARNLHRSEFDGRAIPEAGEEDKAVREAERAEEAIRQRQAQADEQRERAAGTRAKIAALRSEADACDEAAKCCPADAEIEAARAKYVKAKACVEELETKLREARGAMSAAEAEGKALMERKNAANGHARQADGMRAQADELEASLAAVAIAAPTDEESADAMIAHDRAVQNRELIRAARAYQDALAKAKNAETATETLESSASKFDAVVRILTEVAPARLSARSQMIPGVSIDEDGEILLDGTPFDGLSGSERMRFCVEVAKRANAKAKILVVDGLERMSPKGMAEFVKFATADGFQLLATRVTDGELVVEAIEVDGQEEKAA